MKVSSGFAPSVTERFPYEERICDRFNSPPSSAGGGKRPNEAVGGPLSVLPKATGAALALRAPPVLEAGRWLGSSPWNKLRSAGLKLLLPGLDLDASLWFFHSDAALTHEPATVGVVGSRLLGGSKFFHWGKWRPAVRSSVLSLQKHIKEHHEEVRERPCPHPGCNKVFMIDRYLQRHVKLIHTGVSQRAPLTPGEGCCKHPTIRCTRLVQDRAAQPALPVNL